MIKKHPTAFCRRCLTPRVGLEPTTLRLTAECSAIELSRITEGMYLQNRTGNSFHPLPGPSKFVSLPHLLCRGHSDSALLHPHVLCFANVIPVSHVLSDASISRTCFPGLPLQTFWSSPRPISNSQLRTLLHFHLCPIYLVVFKGSYAFAGISHLEGGFTLRCLQRLSLPDLATRLCSWRNNRCTSGQSNPVLSY